MLHADWPAKPTLTVCEFTKSTLLKNCRAETKIGGFGGAKPLPIMATDTR